jgi:hypothetical protein
LPKSPDFIENPTVAIEVPIPVLVWEDRDGIWVTRNTAQYKSLGRVFPSIVGGIKQGRLGMEHAKGNLLARVPLSLIRPDYGPGKGCDSC